MASVTTLPSTTPTTTPTPTPSTTPSTTPTTTPISTTPTTPTTTPVAVPPTTPVDQPTTTPVTTESTTVAANTPVSTNNNGNGFTPTTTPTAALTSTLEVTSTSVGQSTALATSENGQIYTTTVAFTTTLQPGTVVTSAAIATVSHTSNIGAIVGGVVGGLAALFLLALLAIFCLRRRRKHEFDGNFDPANITSGGGGTLPKIDLGEGGIIGDSGGGALIEEDDGMGGRLGAGAGGGGIITPYAFVPPAPVGGAAVGGGGHQYQNPQMSNAGVAGEGVYGNEKRTIRLQHNPSASVSSGSHYPASSNQHYQNLAVGSPEPQSPTTDGVSVDGSGATYYRQSGRGPSPGPSVLSSSSGGAGRNAKEMEATGGRIVVANPDEGTGQLRGFQQAYLESGPGPQHQRVVSSSSLASDVRSSQASPTPSRGGTAVVVHEDGGRVVLRKGEGEPEVLNSEIPPTYDSLPVDVRRES